MTGEPQGVGRIIGSLRSADGKGIVRMEDALDTDVDNLWSALTEPPRLARWLGEIVGDLRVGGEFRVRFFASGWQGTGRVQTCEAPHRLLVVTKDSDEPYEHVIEATLSGDGDQTTLVVEERGMPLDLLAAYGAGVQIHVNDLAAYIAGRKTRDMEGRWDELLPAYQKLATEVTTQ